MEKDKLLFEQMIKLLRFSREKIADVYAVQVDIYNELCNDHCEDSPELVRAWEKASTLDTADEKLVDCINCLISYLEIC